MAEGLPSDIQTSRGVSAAFEKARDERPGRSLLMARGLRGTKEKACVVDIYLIMTYLIASAFVEYKNCQKLFVDAPKTYTPGSTL